MASNPRAFTVGHVENKVPIRLERADGRPREMPVLGDPSWCHIEGQM